MGTIEDSSDGELAGLQTADSPLTALGLLRDGLPPLPRRGESAVRYQRVIRSARWKSLRLLAIAASGGTCTRCHRPGRKPRSGQYVGRVLQLHHLHYDTLGRESLDDVRLLCADCHRAEHRS